MYNQYCKDYEVKPSFSKEFISLWPGWLGPKKSHKLDDVTQDEWARFNGLIRTLSEKYIFKIVSHEHQEITPIKDIENSLATYEESMNKDSSLFTLYLLSELDCLIEEHWDYTYIIWHKGNGAVEKLASAIKTAKLYHFKN
jgi:hypothetical protein